MQPNRLRSEGKWTEPEPEPAELPEGGQDAVLSGVLRTGVGTGQV